MVMKKAIPGVDEHQVLREAIRDLCATYDARYWQGVDEQRAYPEAFVNALTSAGWLAALIPTEYGGSGLGLAQASVIMEEINFSGGNAGSCHGQMYNMGTLLRHGSAQQKAYFLPKIASGEWRLQIHGCDRTHHGYRYHATENHGCQAG
jgi:acyl-CoA dehydrogenase